MLSQHNFTSRMKDQGWGFNSVVEGPGFRPQLQGKKKKPEGLWDGDLMNV